MADTSFATNAAGGGASFAADADGSGFEYPYVKLTFGASGTQTRVSTAAGLPVQQQSGASFTVVGAAADGAAASGNPVLIAGFDGTNAQSLSTTAGGLLQIHDGAGSITVDNGGTFAVQAAATEADGANVTLGAKADAKSTATDVTAVTLMSVSKQISASVQASAASLAGTLTVSGPLTDTQLRASAVPVSLASAPTTAVTLAAGAAAIAKAEDAASADADVGVPAMARRTATPANTSSNDLDYEMLQMSAGRLWTSTTIDAALPAGTNAIGKLAANAGVTIGAVEVAAAQTLGTVTTVSPVTSLTQMNGAAIAMNTGVRAAGVQRVTIATDDVVPITDNSGSLTVDAPVGTPAFVRLSDGAAAIATLPGSLADGASVTLGAKADAKSTATDTTAVTIMSVLKQVSASVQAPPSQAVTNAGTFAVQAMPAVAASWTLTNVNDSASSASLLASNANRRGATFYNDSTESLYLKFGTTASITSFVVKMLPGGYYELPAPIYTGAIDGIWSADASGAVRIGEAA